MSLRIADNLNYQGKLPNFARDTFKTLTDMKSYPDTSLDEGHISLCLEDGKRYKFSSTHTTDPTTGKWRRVVDTALDTNSENPVQNKVVATLLGRIETVNFDYNTTTYEKDSVTLGSTKTDINTGKQVTSDSISIKKADSTDAGVMSAEDKRRIDRIEYANFELSTPTTTDKNIILHTRKTSVKDESDNTKEDLETESIRTLPESTIDKAGVMSALDKITTTNLRLLRSVTHLDDTATFSQKENSVKVNYTCVSTNTKGSALTPHNQDLPVANDEKAGILTGPDHKKFNTTIPEAIGLNSNGTHKQSSGNYTSSAITVEGEIEALDSQLKVVSDRKAYKTVKSDDSKTASATIAEDTLTISGGTDLETTCGTKTLTVNHSAVARTNTNKTDKSTVTIPANGNDVKISDVVVGVESSSTGHVTGVEKNNLTVKHEAVSTTKGTDYLITDVSVNNGHVTGTTTKSFDGDIALGNSTTNGKIKTTIQNNVVGNSKLSDMASKTIKGRKESTTGDPQDLTVAEVRSMLNIADGAEVNQNSFSTIKVGTTNIEADNKTDTLEIAAGTNITLNPDAANDKLTIALTTNPSLGSATATTQGVTENSTKVATTAFVQSVVDHKLAANDAMLYKGVVNQNSDLPKNGYSAGWTYKVGTDGTYAGVNCEVGDMIIATTDSTNGQNAINNSHWSVIQTNVDGSVTNLDSSVNDGAMAIFSGTTGKIIKPATTTGGTNKPIYIGSNGKPTALSSTKGSGTKPVYLSSGSIEESTSNVGSSTKPVYLNGGTITACEYTIESTVPSNAKFTDTDTKVTSADNHYAPTENTGSKLTAGSGTDTILTTTGTNVVSAIKRDSRGHVVGIESKNIKHPSHTAKTSGLYKITVDSLGHVSGAVEVTKDDLVELGIPSTNTTYKPGTNVSISNDTISASTPVTNKDVTLSWGTKSTIATVDGNDINLSLPGNPNTDTKVTSASNHYTPSEDSGSKLTASVTGNATNLTGTSVDVVSAIKRDSRGHVVGIESKKINAGYGVFQRGSSTGGAGVNGLVPAPIYENTVKYLASDGTWSAPKGTEYTAGTNISIKDNVISVTGIKSEVEWSNIKNKPGDLVYEADLDDYVLANGGTLYDPIIKVGNSTFLYTDSDKGESYINGTKILNTTISGTTLKGENNLVDGGSLTLSSNSTISGGTIDSTFKGNLSDGENTISISTVMGWSDSIDTIDSLSKIVSSNGNSSNENYRFHYPKTAGGLNTTGPIAIQTYQSTVTDQLVIKNKSNTNKISIDKSGDLNLNSPIINGGQFKTTYSSLNVSSLIDWYNASNRIIGESTNVSSYFKYPGNDKYAIVATNETGKNQLEIKDLEGNNEITINSSGELKVIKPTITKPIITSEYGTITLMDVVMNDPLSTTDEVDPNAFGDLITTPGGNIVIKEQSQNLRIYNPKIEKGISISGDLVGKNGKVDLDIDSTFSVSKDSSKKIDVGSTGKLNLANTTQVGIPGEKSSCEFIVSPFNNYNASTAVEGQYFGIYASVSSSTRISIGGSLRLTLRDSNVNSKTATITYRDSTTLIGENRLEFSGLYNINAPDTKVTSKSYIVNGGTSDQFLKADGSLDDSPSKERTIVLFIDNSDGSSGGGIVMEEGRTVYYKLLDYFFKNYDSDQHSYVNILFKYRSSTGVEFKRLDDLALLMSEVTTGGSKVLNLSTTVTMPRTGHKFKITIYRNAITTTNNFYANVVKQ